VEKLKNVTLHCLSVNSTHGQNDIIISVGSHFVLNRLLQLEQNVALMFEALHQVNWSGPCSSVFLQRFPVFSEDVSAYQKYSFYDKDFDSCHMTYLHIHIETNNTQNYHTAIWVVKGNDKIVI